MKKLLIAFVLTMSFTVLYAGDGSRGIVGKAVVYIKSAGMFSYDLVLNPDRRNYSLNLVNSGRKSNFKINDYSFEKTDYYDIKMKINGRPYGGTIKVSDCYVYSKGILHTIVVKKDFVLAAMTKSTKTYILKSGSIVTFQARMTNRRK